MKDAIIVIQHGDGSPDGTLRESAVDIIVRADERSKADKVTKERGIEIELRQALSTAGISITAAETSRAVRIIDDVRKGKDVAVIEIKAERSRPPQPQPARRPEFSSATPYPQFTQFFETERTYPDKDAAALYGRLSGIDRQKRELLDELQILLFRSNLETWSAKHHKTTLTIIEAQRARVPLIILEGDVGTGKTALAETIGDPLARLGHGGRVHLLKINTQVRGRGHVGEMSDLIAQAFAQAEHRAQQLNGEPVLLLLDEADALAASRDSSQMHHEDKAGVDTLLQRLDGLKSSSLLIVVLFITNRPDDLDPAIRRRAALSLEFPRPNAKARGDIFKAYLPELNLTVEQVTQLSKATSSGNGAGAVSYTASDITERLLPQALRSAYFSDEPLTVKEILRIAKTITATPPFGVA